jgi:hypothetical protein
MSWRTCGRSEFYRRAKSAFPFLTESNLHKLVARRIVQPIEAPGRLMKFDEAAWSQLSDYVENRCRVALNQRSAIQ